MEREGGRREREREGGREGGERERERERLSILQICIYYYSNDFFFL